MKKIATALVIVIVSAGMGSARTPSNTFGAHEVEQAEAKAAERGKAIAYLLSDSNST